MQDFRRLRVWQEAHQLRLAVYRVTRRFPSEERFGLTAQVRRSACSIATNIAESCGYLGGKASARFLYFSLGSRAETLDHLIAARDLGFLPAEDVVPLEDGLNTVGAMLVGLIRRMNQAPRQSRRQNAKRQTSND